VILAATKHESRRLSSRTEHTIGGLRQQGLMAPAIVVPVIVASCHVLSTTNLLPSIKPDREGWHSHKVTGTGESHMLRVL